MKEENPYQKIKLTEKERFIEYTMLAVAAAMMLFFFVKILFL